MEDFKDLNIDFTDFIIDPKVNRRRFLKLAISSSDISAGGYSRVKRKIRPRAVNRRTRRSSRSCRRPNTATSRRISAEQAKTPYRA